MAIFLDTPTRSLQFVLAGAKNTNDASFFAAYMDEPATQSGTAVATGGTQVGTTNGVTAATVVSAPGAGPGFRRRVKSFSLFNADLAAITVSVQIADTTGPVTTIGQKITLQTLEQLNYEEGYGFEALDANGAQKSQASATSSATSTADSKAVSVSAIASANLSTTTSQSALVSSGQVSLSTVASANLSTATSQGVSGSVVASANLSTFTTASQTTSSQLSLQTSAGTSVTLSKTKSSFGF